MCHPAFAWRPAVASGYRACVATPLQPQLVKELDAALAKLESTDPAAAGPHWGAMHKLLLKAKVDPQALMRIVGARDPRTGPAHLHGARRGRLDAVGASVRSERERQRRDERHEELLALGLHGGARSRRDDHFAGEAFSAALPCFS